MIRVRMSTTTLMDECRTEGCCRTYLQKLLKAVPGKQLYDFWGPHQPLHWLWIQISSFGQSRFIWQFTVTFSNTDHGILSCCISWVSIFEWFITSIFVSWLIGPKKKSIGRWPSIIGSKMGSKSLMLTSVVALGTFIGWIDVWWASSSVLFSSLYPLVAVLLGAAVVVRLLVESVLKSFTAAIVVFLFWDLAGALVVAGVDFVADDDGWVEFLMVTAFVLGLGVVGDECVGVGALWSVKWLLNVTSNIGTSVTKSEWGLKLWIMYSIYKFCYFCGWLINSKIQPNSS